MKREQPDCIGIEKSYLIITFALSILLVLFKFAMPSTFSTQARVTVAFFSKKYSEYVQEYVQ